MKVDSGIYSIYCVANRRRYVGRSRTIRARWRSHRWLLNAKHHFNAPLQNSWSKYGSKKFSFTILESVSTNATEDTWRDRERHWMRCLGTDTMARGFNINDPIKMGVHNERTYVVKHPDGHEENVHGLHGWVLAYNNATGAGLTPSCMSRVAAGRRRDHRGFQVRTAEETWSSWSDRCTVKRRYAMPRHRDRVGKNAVTA